jgi:hypothetical protein
MARGACTFRQRDLAAALKAAQDAGVAVVRVEIGDGKIVLITGKPNGAAESETKREGANEWDAT